MNDRARSDLGPKGGGGERDGSLRPTSAASPDRWAVLARFVAVVVGAAFLLLSRYAVAPIEQDWFPGGEAAAARLGTLLERTRLDLGAEPLRGQVTYFYGPGCASYRGLAIAAWPDPAGGLPAETHLAFALLPEPPLRRNPDRPPLPALTMVRNSLGTDLVPPRDLRQMTVELDLRAGPGDQDGPAPLRVGNGEGRVGQMATTGASRWIEALARRAPCAQSEPDAFVLAVLARTLRVRWVDPKAAAGERLGLAIVREAQPGRFLIEARRLGQRGGRATFGARLWQDGELGSFRLEVHPRVERSDLELAVALGLRSPRLGGSEASGSAGEEAIGGGPSSNGAPRSATFDLSNLLVDTAWLPGQ